RFAQPWVDSTAIAFIWSPAGARLVTVHSPVGGFVMIARPLAILAALCLCGTSAQALTSKECSAKYQAAKTAGTLNGQKWNDFRKAQCGADATPVAAPAAAPAAPAAPPPATTAAAKPKKEAAPAPAPPPVATGNAAFPAAVDPKFASEKPELARIHTCSEQWKANKANNTTGGMKWTVKGGGYWPECNKRLKGPA